MPTSKKRIHLAAFMNAGPMGTVGWRHPEADPGFLTAEYYTSVARTLEAAKFDLVFIPDSLAVPRSLGGSFAPAVTHGAGTPRLDPIPVISIISAVTSRLGVVSTSSTGYSAPYSVARSYATLDHLSGGRAGWNVVTSFQDAEAQNYGQPALPARPERYARAEEFLEAVTRLWDSWGDDSVIADRASGVFGDAETVHAIDFVGRHLSVQGPLGVPRSPQGYPVIVQAGASPEGRDFAARWSDVIFCSHDSLESAVEFYADVKRRAADHGRDPDQIKILPAIAPILAPSRAEAEEKHRVFERLVDPVAGLSRLAYHINFDLTAYDLDGPLPDIDVQGVQGHYREVVERARRTGMTIRQLGSWYGARTEGDMLGSAAEVADRLELWVEAGAADGFMVIATQVPTAFAEFAEQVVPELQRRGVFREEYEGTTLREHLGLRRPERGEWRNRARSGGAR
ncbi:LLM class flavin-dependent oxidoreductase [Leucobacter weissii]|uniref:LLM class flavin-dependent oxidoreductase n=1 Tax=Leucobacter weissii TaxID=1983706 RepID=A0A939SA95_9MICO|nr:LLM class flavin-dependent oxidoreductase [Leucobacter weissii]MBO1901707.1 LLM class flavin-dependent oxidoreductase [Leucobacter weissii]